MRCVCETTCAEGLRELTGFLEPVQPSSVLTTTTAATAGIALVGLHPVVA